MEGAEGVPTTEADSKETVILTNIGREVSSEDVLCFTERRGTAKFVSLLTQGKIVSPGLAKEKGESFIDKHGQNTALLSTEREPNAIYTSLHGPYWPEGYTLVFNAWDTLNEVRFNDNGNTGVRLYNRETDEKFPEINFLDESLKESRDFLILVPNEHAEGALRRQFYWEARDTMTNKEQDEFFNRHIIKPKAVLQKAKEYTRSVVEESPEVIELIKRQAKESMKETENEKFKEAYRKITESEGLHELAVEYIVHGLMGEQYALNNLSVTGKFTTIESSDQESGSIPGSVEGIFAEYNDNSNEENKKIIEAGVKIGDMMQDWLKEEFQERFGSKKDRKGTVEIDGKGEDARTSLTIHQE